MRTSQPTTTNNTGAHGLGGGLGAAAAQRLPVPPRERKPALAALAVILILGGALVSAYLVMESGQRVSAVSISQPVAAGEQIPAGALKQVQIGNTGIQFINWSEHTKITQSYAAVNLVPDTLLTNRMISRSADGAKGRMIVGLELKAAQRPASGLRLGDKLAIYAVGGRDSAVKAGTLLSSDALITFVAGVGSTATRPSSTSSSSTRISVAVLPDQVQPLIQSAATGSIAIALVPAGTTVTIPQAAPAGPGTRAQKPGG
ncbi:MAG: hypothetical protein ABIS86_00195 [Streptosporangiaceae bacterium]